MAGSFQRYNPPREVYVATDKGVKKMSMETADLAETGGGLKLFVSGRLWQARSGTWTKHKRERRAIGDRVFGTQKEARAVYNTYKARIVAAAKERLAMAKADLARVTRRPAEGEGDDQ